MSSLANLKVLDLTTHLSGPYCSMILADHGADVVKVEKPNGGDPLRHSPPFQKGESAPFMLWNRNKRSITIDLKTKRGREILFELVDDADVFVQNFRPGVAERMGIGEEVLRSLVPDIIYFDQTLQGD